MTKRQLDDIQLPTEQYDPVTNWMADLPPLTKKPRAIHPRQRGHNKNNINKQRYLPKQHQQHQPGQQSHERIKSQPVQPLQKKPLDDGLLKGKCFPLKDARLEIQRLREVLPLDQNPKFVTSLDYSLTTEK